MLLDVKGVPALLNGDLQVVVGSQLPLDQVDSCISKEMLNSQWA